MWALFFPALHLFQHCCSVNNYIEQHNSMIEVNEDDFIVNTDHNIPADATDFVNSKGPVQEEEVAPSFFGSDLTMIHANEIE